MPGVSSADQAEIARKTKIAASRREDFFMRSNSNNHQRFSENTDPGRPIARKKLVDDINYSGDPVAADVTRIGRDGALAPSAPRRARRNRRKCVCRETFVPPADARAGTAPAHRPYQTTAPP